MSTYLVDDEGHCLGVGVDELEAAVVDGERLAVLAPLDVGPRVAAHLQLQHRRTADRGVDVAQGRQDLGRLGLLSGNSSRSVNIISYVWGTSRYAE